MRRWLPWIVAALVGAAVVHVAVVRAVPYVVMRIAMNRVGAGEGVGSAIFPPRADATSRAIVRPSPDLLYSTCVFDVSERPLRITAQIPRDTYWSISMFAANTDNFFKLNDREAGSRHLDFVLARPGAQLRRPGGARVIEAPSMRGIILTRTLIADEARFPELEQARRAFSCSPL